MQSREREAIKATLNSIIDAISIERYDIAISRLKNLRNEIDSIK